MQVIISIGFLVCITLLSALKSQGQTCRTGSTYITVKNSEGKSIPNLTIELMPEILSYQEYEKYLQGEPAIKVAGLRGAAVKLSVENAEAILKRGKPISRHLYSESQLKRPASAKAPKDLRDEAGVIHFHFCTSEDSYGVVLVKISAPAYTTDYYAGRFLLGCYRSLYEFTLFKEGRP